MWGKDYVQSTIVDSFGSFVLDFLGQIIPWEDKYSEIKWSDLYPLKGYDIKSAS